MLSLLSFYTETNAKCERTDKFTLWRKLNNLFTRWNFDRYCSECYLSCAHTSRCIKNAICFLLYVLCNNNSNMNSGTRTTITVLFNEKCGWSIPIELAAEAADQRRWKGPAGKNPTKEDAGGSRKHVSSQRLHLLFLSSRTKSPWFAWNRFRSKCNYSHYNHSTLICFVFQGLFSMAASITQLSLLPWLIQ